MSENLQTFINQEQLWSTEGRRGIENLCKIVSAMGYKDPQYFGQLSRGATLGDLLLFLEDNSGAVEAIIEWIDNRNEWDEQLESQLYMPTEEEA